MRRSPRRSGFAGARAPVAIAAATLVLVSGCASHRPGAPAPTPGEVYRSLLGRNPGLTSVRAVAEAHIAFAGREVSLPGVLLLDSYGGFRLDLLDPLDRPLAIFFTENSRIVHYRPGLGLAASLAVFPDGCRGVDPADWVPAVLAASLAPVAGERLAVSSLLFGGHALERYRGSELHQSIRYEIDAGQATPGLISWYCGEESVLQLRLREWVQGLVWRLPSRFEILFPKAGLTIGIELREIEGNPPPSSQPFRPKLGSEIRWTGWNLPQ